jgi:DNA-binding CsgD family transcriptional regulator
VGVSTALLRGIGSTNGGSRRTRNATPLTGREEEVASLVAGGFTNKEIAARLHIAPGTVKSHVHNVIRKLGVARRAHVARKLPQDNLLPLVTGQRADPVGSGGRSDSAEANGIGQPPATHRQLSANFLASAEKAAPRH